MLMLHCATPNDQTVLDLELAALSPSVHWIDIFEETEKEIAFVERAIGRHIPKLDELKEIENSSRLHFEKGAFCLSTPLVWFKVHGWL